MNEMKYLRSIGKGSLYKHTQSYKHMQVFILFLTAIPVYLRVTTIFSIFSFCHFLFLINVINLFTIMVKGETAKRRRQGKLYISENPN